MTQLPRTRQVESESSIGIGRIQIIRQVWQEPINIVGQGPHHHLELTLLPTSRNAKVRFVDHWGPQRFEPMGSLFFLPADQIINARSDCRCQNSVVCDFDPVAVERWLEQDLRWTDSRLSGVLDIGSVRIRQLLFAIAEELRTPRFASESMVELMAAQIALELSRHLLGIDDERHTGGLASWRLNLIDERLAEQSTPPSLTELATLCGLSVRQLARAFRVSRGCSLGSHIAEQRLNHAKRMLAEGMSIKRVAFDTGFSAPSNFTAAFVRATGEAPRQYRARTAGGAQSRWRRGR